MDPSTRLIFKIIGSVVTFTIVAVISAVSMSYYRKQGKAAALRVDGGLILRTGRAYRVMLMGSMIFAGLVFLAVFVFVVFINDDVGTVYRVFMSALALFVFAILPFAYMETAGINVLITTDGIAIESGVRNQLILYDDIAMVKDENDYVVLLLTNRKKVRLPKTLVGWEDGRREIERCRCAAKS